MAQEPDTLSDHNAATSEGDSSAPPGSSAEIRSQIEATRTEISDTLDALHDRLSPNHLVATAKERVPAIATGVAAAAAIVVGLKYLTAPNRDRWLLAVGACAGFVCWSAWRAEPPRSDVLLIDDDFDVADPIGP